MDTNHDHKKVNWECRFFTKSSSEYLDFIPEKLVGKIKNTSFECNEDKYIYIKNIHDVVKIRDNRVLQIKEFLFSDYLYEKFSDKIEIKFPIAAEDAKKIEHLMVFLKKIFSESDVHKYFHKRVFDTYEDLLSLLKDIGFKFKVVNIYKQRLKFCLGNDISFEVSQLRIKDKSFRSFCFEGHDFNKMEAELKNVGLFEAKEKKNLEELIKLDDKIVFGYATFLKWLEKCHI